MCFLKYCRHHTILLMWQRYMFSMFFLRKLNYSKQKVQGFIWCLTLKFCVGFMNCEIFYCCGGECEVVRSDRSWGIKVKDGKEAHQAIITRLKDLRCERWCTRMLMHIGGQSRPLRLTRPHANTKPCNLLWLIERQGWLVVFTDT